MDPSKILIWNVRGLNRKSRRDAVRSMVADTRPDIVCLQETKKEATSRRMVMSMLGGDFDEFVTLPAVGTRGGILVAWKSGVCKALDIRVDVFSVSVRFDHVDDSPWWFTGVYGPRLDAMKVQFLQELRNVCQGCQGPWIVGG